MYEAMLNDGRLVLVDPTHGTRMVEGKEYFLLPTHVMAFLGGGWQVVRKSRLRKATYGSPFALLRI